MKRIVVVCVFMLTALMVFGGGKKDADAAKDQEGKTKIVFWTWQPREDQWDEILYPAFKAEYPDIEVEFWRTAEQSDYLKKLQVGISSGTGPDVFALQPGSLVNQYQRFCEPMDSFADRYIQGWRDLISRAAIEQSTSLNGIVAGMPILMAGQEFMLYNETLMKECGVTQVPRTYAELVAAAKKISAARKTPAVMGAADIWHDVDWFVWASQQFAPGRIYEAEKGRISWTDQAFVDTMNAWVRYFRDGVFQDGALGVGTYPDARDQYFFTREAVFFPTGSWHVGAVLPNFAEIQGTSIQKDVIGMTSFPQVGPQKVAATTGVDVLFSVNKDSRQKEAAAKLIAFFSVGKGQQLWTDTLQGSPVNSAIKYGGDMSGPLAEASINYINALNNASTAKRKLDYAELETALGVAMQEAAAGRGVLDVLADVQAVSASLSR
ncbi:MAG: extracellular solute-binding protein [Treponema sp.]|jgi:raffinose/stachyose/melibiose transport system substrate-binding protein|nr:extracellular solute-binding protein [Treponema sp.]